MKNKHHRGGEGCTKAKRFTKRLSPSLPPPTALPHALVMRRRLIDWGWRYDYLPSPPPSSSLFTFSYSLPTPAIHQQGIRHVSCMYIDLCWLYESGPTHYASKDGGRAQRAHQGPTGASAGLHGLQLGWSGWASSLDEYLHRGSAHRAVGITLRRWISKSVRLQGCSNSSPFFRWMRKCQLYHQSGES